MNRGTNEMDAGVMYAIGLSLGSKKRKMVDVYCCIVEVEVGMATAFEVFKASAQWERELWQNPASRRSNLSYGTHAGQNGEGEVPAKSVQSLFVFINILYFTVLYSN